MLFQKRPFRTFLEPWLRKEKKMLKKTLIAIAILGLVVPAFAADTFTQKKFHEFIPTKVYEWATVGQVNVCMDVGYWIQIDFRGKCIEVQQNSALGNPFESYSGCLDDVKVITNFNATLKATIASASAAGGDWKATLDGGSTYVTGGKGTFLIDVCVAGTKVKIQNLTALTGTDKITVAIVTVKVLPTGYNPA
jgi:hypothetical protein